MSNILNLISNIDTENNVEAEKIFTSIILDKISDKMDAMRTNLAKDMFSESNVEDTSELDEVLTILENSQLDEISKATLGSYIKKAALNSTQHGYSSGVGQEGSRASARNPNDRHLMQMQKFQAKKNYDVSQKRLKGIATATDKITKEDVELDSALEALDNIQLDESLRRKIRSVFPKMARAIDNSMYKLKNDFTTPKERHTLRVMKRIGKKVFNEEVEYDEVLTILENSQLDEISKTTLVNYIRKAAKSSRDNGFTAGEYAEISRDKDMPHKDAEVYHKAAERHHEKSRVRIRNINLAANKLSNKITKEEVDQSAIDKFYTDNK